MEIVAYQEQYKQDFIALNTAWLERFFVMEEEDRVILDHVEEVLEAGAMIFFAVEDNAVLATCMAMPMEEAGAWEICKLAATGQYTGKGAGTAVFKACMDYAIAHGAKKLVLISNRILKPALHIYEKAGFQEVPLNQGIHNYERADIQMEYLVPQETKMKKGE